MLIGLGLLAAAAPMDARAQATVTSVSPANGSHDAPVDTDVTATLSNGATSGVNADNFVIHRSQSARTGVDAVGGTVTLTANPFNNFQPGEQVGATITSGIQTGAGPVTPFVWQFRTRADQGGGEGVFAQSSNSLGNEVTRSVALGDVDGDGDLDAVDGARVWLNDQGTFVLSASSLGVSSTSDVALGDVDGDGDLDVMAGDQVWVNAGSGTFNYLGSGPGTSGLRDIDLGDLDGDGDLDAFVANSSSSIGVFDPNRVWLNEGGGTFTQSSNSLGGSYSLGVDLGDVDGDGDLDAFVANGGLGTEANRVWLNEGSGTFTQSANSLGNVSSGEVSLGDVDGDGDLDALVTENTRIQLWRNNGSGAFVLGGNLSGAGTATHALGDIDGDGDLDLFVGHSSNYPSYGANRVWLNEGSGTFTLTGNSLGDSRTSAVQLGDLDGDGDLDAFVGNGSFTNEADRVWINTLSNQEFGDAPAPLPTNAFRRGPSHTVGGPRLGDDVDTELLALPNNDATGDDLDGFDDEDGVTQPGTIMPGTPGATVSVDIQNAAGRLDAWVDFNADGSFDGAWEQIFTSRSLAPGSHDIAFTAPADTPGGDVVARFRLSSAGGLGARGPAADGEVEDHRLFVDPPAGSGFFGDSGNSLGAASSRSVDLGDIDGDGDLDAVVANDNQAGGIWLNAGAGTFSAVAAPATVMTGRAVRFGDLDRDGDLDAFFGNIGANRFWLNNGGAFAEASQSLGNALTQGLALGDVDGDGDLDAFTANFGVSRVWLNEGSGTFSQSANSLGMPSSPDSRDVVLADLDGDGDLDAFVANFRQPNRVWVNAGSGTFSQSANSLGGADSQSVALGDLDGDGDLDAFVANGNEANRVWLNDDNGGFTESSNSLGAANSHDVRLADLDGDGDLDAFVVNFAEPDRVWLNDGSGTFSESFNSLDQSNGLGVRLGDLDGDGDLDAFVANGLYRANRVWLNVAEDFGDAPAPLPTLSTDNGARHLQQVAAPRLGALVDEETDGLPNAGATGDDSDGVDDEDGVTFTGTARVGQPAASVSVNVGSLPGRLDAWLDLNDDGSFDGEREQVFSALSLAVGNHDLGFTIPSDAVDTDIPARFRISTGGVRSPRGVAQDGEVEDHFLTVLPPVAGGEFVLSGNSLTSEAGADVALGDLDGDGDLDAFVANDNDPNRVWLNDGSGSFVSGGASLGNARSFGVVLGDIDDDGDLDAFVNNFSSVNKIWVNDGDGNFSDGGSIPNGGFGAALGDMDGDGDLDVVIAQFNFADQLWLNDGSGSFLLAQTFGLTNGRAAAVGDLDTDGDLDIVFIAYGTEGDRAWLNDGSGSFSPLGSLGISNGRAVALGDLDADGDLDAVIGVFGAPNQVWFNDGSGTFSVGDSSLGSGLSNGVTLGDIDGDGDLDIFVSNRTEVNRVYLNDGSGGFAQSSNSFGVPGAYSYGTALGDLDGDGTLDAFVANDGSEPSQVWLNTPLDTDSDGVFDTFDNCPDDANPDQEDMDNDGEGNACDDDVDGDGMPNATDDDDDNDGLADVDDPNPIDPDTDDDGVIDGLDRDPDDASNVLDTCVSPDALLNLEIMDETTCAATQSIETINPAGVTATGDLLMISPEVSLGTGFSVETSGRLTVISKDPTATPP